MVRDSLKLYEILIGVGRSKRKMRHLVFDQAVRKWTKPFETHVSISPKSSLVGSESAGELVRNATS
jgi:hypothetical protein